NGFVNLALPFFAFSEPIPPAKTKCLDFEFTEWDSFDYDHDITLQGLIDDFAAKRKLELTMVSSNVSMLYASFHSKKKLEQRLPMKISEILQTVTNKAISEHVKWLLLDVCCEDAEGEDVEVPSVRIKIRD
ncbi:E1 ubiquitin-activating protein, partial [Coemansia erecta]